MASKAVATPKKGAMASKVVITPDQMDHPATASLLAAKPTVTPKQINNPFMAGPLASKAAVTPKQTGNPSTAAPTASKAVVTPEQVDVPSMVGSMSSNVAVTPKPIDDSSTAGPVASKSLACKNETQPPGNAVTGPTLQDAPTSKAEALHPRVDSLKGAAPSSSRKKKGKRSNSANTSPSTKDNEQKDSNVQEFHAVQNHQNDSRKSSGPTCEVQTIGSSTIQEPVDRGDAGAPTASVHENGHAFRSSSESEKQESHSSNLHGIIVSEEVVQKIPDAEAYVEDTKQHCIEEVAQKLPGAEAYVEKTKNCILQAPETDKDRVAGEEAQKSPDTEAYVQQTIVDCTNLNSEIQKDPVVQSDITLGNGKFANEPKQSDSGMAQIKDGSTVQKPGIEKDPVAHTDICLDNVKLVHEPRQSHSDMEKTNNRCTFQKPEIEEDLTAHTGIVVDNPKLIYEPRQSQSNMQTVEIEKDLPFKNFNEKSPNETGKFTHGFEEADADCEHVNNTEKEVQKTSIGEAYPLQTGIVRDNAEPAGGPNHTVKDSQDIDIAEEEEPRKSSDGGIYVIPLDFGPNYERRHLDLYRDVDDNMSGGQGLIKSVIGSVKTAVLGLTRSRSRRGNEVQSGVIRE
ncbi:hypothetical protein KP509_01G058400 [Ceratopteris richardii]|uniref:Uncharacterized protein n=1 Tax=Ceratopteris richardii TaxID=49495 RepID=A0A8T2VHA7_CERRI|nr:hypothetical protein KP509_01G058400 [Ceratopteris richardii]